MSIKQKQVFTPGQVARFKRIISYQSRNTKIPYRSFNGFQPRPTQIPRGGDQANWIGATSQLRLSQQNPAAYVHKKKTKFERPIWFVLYSPLNLTCHVAVK